MAQYYWMLISIIALFTSLILFMAYNNWIKNKVNKATQKNLYPIRIPPKKIKIRRIIKEKEAEEQREEEKVIVQQTQPELTKLKNLLSDFINNDNKWDCIIAIGDIYRKGAFPRFLPNEYLAIECYKVASMCPNGDIAGLAQVKYIEARTEEINSEDKKGENFPTEYGIQICEAATERIKRLPLYAFEKPKMQKPSIKKREKPKTVSNITAYMDRAPDNDYNYMGLFENTDDNYDFNPDLNNFDINNLFRPDNAIPVNNTVYKSDSQNVHDHSVVSIANKNLKEISKESNLRDSPQKTIEQIRDFILGNEEMTDKQASDALLVLDKLGTTKNSSFDMSEQDVLTNVWNKISNEQDPQLKNNLAETLGKQLASAVENGHVVCSTGKVVRILGTFDGIEDDKLDSVKPLWAIKEELSNLASKVRDDHLNNLSEPQKLAYERNELSELDEKMKKEFREKANDIYVNNLKMSEKIVSPIISMYEDAF